MNDVTDDLRFEGLDELLGKVEDEMTTSIVTLDPDTRTSDAVAVLRRRGIGGAPVVEGRRVIGVATVSDLSALMPLWHTTDECKAGGDPQHQGEEMQQLVEEVSHQAGPVFLREFVRPGPCQPSGRLIAREALGGGSEVDQRGLGR